MQARQPRKHSRLFLIFAYLLLAWAIPLIISLGRLLSSAGQSAFVFPKFMDFVNSWNNHGNTTMPVAHNTTTPPFKCDQQGGNQDCMSGGAIAAAFASILCNVIVNLCTRIPAIFNEFRSHYKNLKKKKELPLEIDTTGVEPYFNFKGMSFSSAAIYATLKGINLASGGFVALSTYLSLISLLAFLEQCILHTTIAEHHPRARIALYESTALLFAITSFLNYIIYNVRTGDKNAKTFAINLTQVKCPAIDRTLLATLLSASPATICVGPMAFFTTYHALQKICWVNIPANVRYTFAGASFVTASVARVLTDVPAMYHLMETRFHPEKHNNTRYSSCLVTPYKGFVYSAGFGDSIGTAITNFTGLINTTDMVLGVPQQNPVLIAISATCAISSGGLNFAFGVHNGAKKSIKLFFSPQTKETPYERLPATESIEAQGDEDIDVEAAHPPVASIASPFVSTSTVWQ